MGEHELAVGVPDAVEIGNHIASIFRQHLHLLVHLEAQPRNWRARVADRLFINQGSLTVSPFREVGRVRYPRRVIRQLLELTTPSTEG